MSQPDYIDANGEKISADSIRARMSRDSQRDIDKRMAAWFSTSSEHAAYNADDVRELYKQAR